MSVRLSYLAALVLLFSCSKLNKQNNQLFEVDANTIPAPLTNQAGDPKRGEAIFTEREKGHCILCHTISSLDAEFQGTIGPDLSAVGIRLSAVQMRLLISDASYIFPDTVMPPYYRLHNLNQVAGAYKNKTALSAQDVEDLISYLRLQTG